MRNRMILCTAALGLFAAAPAAADAAPHEAGGPTVMRRLTEAQYRNVIGDVFGHTIELGGRFEPDLRVEELLAVGAGQASVSAGGLEQYDLMARSISRQVVDAEHRLYTIECRPAATDRPDAACAGRFLGRVGRLLNRRPLSPPELQRYVGAAGAATAMTKDFYSGLALALAGILTSPQFLYRQERAEPDPREPGTMRLDAYSKAQRLSFLLWNTAPDPDLLAAAERGDIHTAEGLARQVDRLLSSPRLESGVRAFFADMLAFDGFDKLTKDTALYPNFTFAAQAQAQEQTLRTLVDMLVARGRDYRDVFTTRETFLTPALGALYGVPVAADGADAWVPYTFPAGSGQAGILTHASFVALHSHAGRSSPTLRGRAIRELLLCTKVPDPPANVDFTLFEDTQGARRTARDRLGAHVSNPACAGCHKITDPIGLALETFDTAGGARATENGAAIDTAGVLDGVTFADAAGLGQALRDNPRTVSCLIRRLVDYAIGRKETASEEAWRTRALEAQFAAVGYRIPALLRGLATAEAFYRVVPAPAAQKATVDNRPQPEKTR